MVNNGRSRLEAVIQEYTDRNFTLIEPGGNHGDSLIYRGLYKIVDHIGVEYRTFNHLNRMKKDSKYKIRRGINLLFEPLDLTPVKFPIFDSPEVVIIHGGGNFNDIWESGLLLFKNIIRNYDNVPVIVAPQTYWFDRTEFGRILQSSTQPIHLFCRERYSYTLLQRFDLPDNVNVEVSADTALFLNRSDLDSYVSDEKIPHPAGEYDICSFRVDKEGIVPTSTVEELGSADRPVITEDISLKHEFSFVEFVSLVDQAATVYTDRLHVSILGAITGTETELFENIYYKNRGVYKHSLAGLNHVQFNDAIKVDDCPVE